MIMVYITNPDRKTAEMVVSKLVDAKLAACGNIFPISSIYRWKGVKKEEEFVSIVKTKAEMWRKLKQMVKDIHPYEVSCIIKIQCEANQEYEKWINESVNQA
jgi:periplasmic divalent cation tolerance protein